MDMFPGALGESPPMRDERSFPDRLLDELWRRLAWAAPLGLVVLTVAGIFVILRDGDLKRTLHPKGATFKR